MSSVSGNPVCVSVASHASLAARHSTDGFREYAPLFSCDDANREYGSDDFAVPESIISASDGSPHNPAGGVSSGVCVCVSSVFFPTSERHAARSTVSPRHALTPAKSSFASLGRHFAIRTIASRRIWRSSGNPGRDLTRSNPAREGTQSGHVGTTPSERTADGAARERKAMRARQCVGGGSSIKFRALENVGNKFVETCVPKVLPLPNSRVCASIEAVKSNYNTTYPPLVRPTPDSAAPSAFRRTS